MTPSFNSPCLDGPMLQSLEVQKLTLNEVCVKNQGAQFVRSSVYPVRICGFHLSLVGFARGLVRSCWTDSGSVLFGVGVIDRGWEESLHFGLSPLSPTAVPQVCPASSLPLLPACYIWKRRSPVSGYAFGDSNASMRRPGWIAILSVGFGIDTPDDVVKVVNVQGGGRDTSRRLPAESVAIV
ncbi:hypothetical protein Tco_0779529 [Tanacetum coccineum]